MSEMKSVPDGINGRLDIAGKKKKKKHQLRIHDNRNCPK